MNITFEKFFQTGMDSFRKKNWMDALDNFEKILDVNPTNMKVLTLKGWCLLELCSFVQAISIFNLVIKSSRGSFFAFEGKALAFFNLGCFEESIECCNKCLEREICMEILELKGKCLICLGRFKEAKSCFELSNLFASSQKTSPTIKRIEIELAISENSKTCHKIVWEVFNPNNLEAEGAFFYVLSGAVPRTLEEVRLAITADSKILQYRTLLDLPKTKAIQIFMDRPLEPWERKLVNIQYDWEEPDRNFSYRPHNKSKFLSFRLIAPAKMSIEPSVQTYDSQTDKSEAEKIGKIQYFKKTIEFGWDTENVEPRLDYTIKW